MKTKRKLGIALLKTYETFKDITPTDFVKCILLHSNAMGKNINTSFLPKDSFVR